MTNLAETSVVVTGASRGFGAAAAAAFVDAGAHVVGVARDADRLAVAARTIGFTAHAADAADESTATRLIERYDPRVVVLCAGAPPGMRPLPDHDWESFSVNWHVDVQQVFRWTKAALTAPLAAGSRVIALSSGAAVKGSPLSGGYAGAKSTIRFLTAYAADEAEREGLGIGFTALLPQLTPATRLGADAVAAYARRAGRSVDDHVRSLGPTLSAEQVGAALVDLASGDATSGSYLLAAAGLSRLD